MNISLPKSLENFVGEQIEKGLYSSQSEVLRAGLRLLQEKQNHINIEIAKSLKQMQEGNYSKVNDEFWAKLKKKVANKIEKDQL